MSRDPLLYVRDMRDACTAVLTHAQGLTRDAFFADAKVLHATLWNLMVLGEAAKRVPEVLRVEHESIEWRKVAGFRDVLAHGYFGLDEDIVWNVVSTKIEPPKDALDRILLEGDS